MTYDPNDLNRPLNPNSRDSDLDLRTTPVERRSRTWIGWVAAIAVVAVAAFAYMESNDAGTDPRTTASTTNSQPAPAPAKPMAPADNATPAPATPPAAPAQQ